MRPISAISDDGGYHGQAYQTRRPPLLSRSFLSVASRSHQRHASKPVFKRCVGDVELQEKLGRNDPCPCGSGKRYKRCCLKSGKFDGSRRDYYFQRAPVIRRSTVAQSLYP
ncbi:SEC-C metal-binding domain-containing protein [uncultured Roseobacter sp.]|uniref:SEC-C metal-binding domain-containing protein n=1 Tax=uncultured Roseobacter sp. TaxID=114847 RepID=UPI00344D4D7A